MLIDILREALWKPIQCGLRKLGFPQIDAATDNAIKETLQWRLQCLDVDFGNGRYYFWHDRDQGV